VKSPLLPWFWPFVPGEANATVEPLTTVPAVMVMASDPPALALIGYRPSVKVTPGAVPFVRHTARTRYFVVNDPYAKSALSRYTTASGDSVVAAARPDHDPGRNRVAAAVDCGTVVARHGNTRS